MSAPHLSLSARREKRLGYKTLDLVMERKDTPDGWNMSGILQRHRWLLQQLADRWALG